MSSPLRMLALVLALTGSLAPQVATALDAFEDCAEEEGGCADCATCTTPCECCTVRVATLTAVVLSPLIVVVEADVVVRVDEPVLAAVNPDIFHPPRA